MPTEHCVADHCILLAELTIHSSCKHLTAASTYYTKTKKGKNYLKNQHDLKSVL